MVQDKQKKNTMEKKRKLKGPIKEWRNKCSENAVTLKPNGTP